MACSVGGREETYFVGIAPSLLDKVWDGVF